MTGGSVFDRFCTGVAILLLMLVGLATLCHLSGCQGVGGNASHQHGLVLYGGVDGRVGLGYGEIENVPFGSIFIREVYQLSPTFFWQRPGTNVTATVTFWNTCPTNFIPHTLPPND